MINRQRMFQSVAWAWAAGWVLVSMCYVVADVSSLPNRGLAAIYGLGFAGWTIGAAGTISYVRHRFGADVYVIALSVAGWGVGALVAVVLLSVGFQGLIVGAALGGAIGGGLTLPMRSPSSSATIVRASVRRAFNWGVSFLVFQFLAFYIGYFLLLMAAAPLASIVGWGWAKAAVWALPAGVGGFLAARLASRSLHFTERGAA